MTTRTPRSLLTAVTLSSLALTSTATPAQSAEPPPDNAYTRTIRYAELDLTRQHGVTVLYDRIRRAAQAVCDPFRGYSLLRYRYEQECVEQAVAEAVAKVAHPKVTAYHVGKTS